MNRTSNPLPVPLIAQETDFWCWAACAQMIMRYKGRDVSQVDQASKRFGTDCGIDPTPLECLEPGWPDFQAWGFHAESTGPALTMEQIKDQIDANMPVAFAVLRQSGYHMRVAIGYDVSNETVLVHDPEGEGSTYLVSHDEYVGDPGHHVDYYNIRET
jgi:hypothetical protein